MGKPIVATAIRRDASIIVRELEGEMLVLDRRTDRVHQFNRSGSFIWKRLHEGQAPEAIAAALVGEFDVSDAVARQDLEAFLDVLGSLDLLEGGRHADILPPGPVRSEES
jgi:hypothetical protein